MLFFSRKGCCWWWYDKPCSSVGVVSIRTGRTVRGSISCRYKIILSYPKNQYRLMRPTWPFSQHIQEILSSGIKWPEPKANHSLPPSHDTCSSSCTCTYRAVLLSVCYSLCATWRAAVRLHSLKAQSIRVTPAVHLQQHSTSSLAPPLIT